MEDLEYISLGGWCGTKMSLVQLNKSFSSYPFDYVRSSIFGVIDCLNNDFLTFFPYKKQVFDDVLFCPKLRQSV